MPRSKYPRSVAKHIRRRKAEIRKQVQNKEEQEKLIRDFIREIDESRTTK